MAPGCPAPKPQLRVGGPGEAEQTGAASRQMPAGASQDGKPRSLPENKPALESGATEGEEMNRLRRFYEKVPYGRTSSRVAYATSRAALPEAAPEAEWTEDAAFNAGDAVLANPLLKEIYKEAILKGCAFEKVKTR